MIDNWQTPVAILVVAVALATLLRGTFSKKKKTGCGGGFCPTDKFKAGLKH